MGSYNKKCKYYELYTLKNWEKNEQVSFNNNIY